MNQENLSSPKWKTQLSQLIERVRQIDKRITQERIPQDLSVRTSATQFQPIQSVLQGFIPWTKQQAQLYGKQVEVVIETSKTLEVPDHVAKATQQMLYHLIQNAIIHGIEQAEDRNQFGKSVIGKITLGFENLETEYRLTVKDDGYGYHQRHKDADKKQRETFGSLLSEFSEATQTESPFLTQQQEQPLELPLGVGMHVVRHWVNSLQGALDIQSSGFEHSTVEISIPKATV